MEKTIKVTLEKVFGFTEALSGGDRYTCFKTLKDGRTMQIWFPHSDAVWNPKVISLSIYEDCDHSNYYREDYFKAFDSVYDLLSKLTTPYFQTFLEGK